MTGAPWALIGATGITGRLILERALLAGHRPKLIGRPSGPLLDLAARYSLPHAALRLEDAHALRAALAGRRLVLNVAGPFSATGPPVIAAALATHCDYLDLTGELAPLVTLLDRHAAARAAGVVLVGGCGFGVAATDGLAMRVSERLGGADRLRISVAADNGYGSPTVAKSVLEVLAGGGREVEGGELVGRPMARTGWALRSAAGREPLHFASAPLAELIAAAHASHVSDIVAGIPLGRAAARLLRAASPVLPALIRTPVLRDVIARSGGHGAKAPDLLACRSSAVVEGWKGEDHRMVRLDAGEGFQVAADIALAAVGTTLLYRPPVGAHTPATAFGAGFIDQVPGITVSEA